jgi:16S rRNA (cytidine1402-2'-O)-methyltransferase
VNACIGSLYIVATPIGNLQDMTLRAIEVLKTADLIVAEDTRQSKVLLNHYDIKTKAQALHEHNEQEHAQKLVALMLKGQSIALISDAGTPLISDPGYRVVALAREAGIVVHPLPGPCAAIAALSVSGLPTDRFIFEGFLPAKSVARSKYMDKLKTETATLVFYEAPHRVLETLKDMLVVFGGERLVVVARELTKMFETVRSGPLPELIAWMEADPNQTRGEFVLLVAGCPQGATDELTLSVDKLLEALVKALPLNQAVKLTCELSGLKKNDIYKQALAKVEFKKEV